MRRKDREVTEINKIYEIIDNCQCCRIGFNDDDEVYIVPLNFGYDVLGDEITLYFHGAKEGRKVDLIKKSKNVGFEMDTNYALMEGDVACSYSAQYQSIIGNGEISFVEELEEKKHGLQKIMYQSTKKSGWEFNDKMVSAVCVFKIKVKKLSCKMHEA